MSGALPPALLIFGYGNPSRGDDALAPALLEVVERRLAAPVREAAGGVEILTDFQLQVEHALDLVGRRLVLFVDAHATCPAPFRFEVVEPANDTSYTSHAISPAAVLHCYRTIHRAPPPPTFSLGIRGECFELGEGLSEPAQGALSVAIDRVLELCAHPDPRYWEALARSG